MKQPAEVCYPGEHLRDELEAHGKSVVKFIKEFYGMYRIDLRGIINGDNDITNEIARDLAHRFGTSPDYWMNLQRAWDATKCATREEQVMGTTRDEIKAWLENAKKQGATHMLVVCDTFDHEDYQVHVMPGESVKMAIEKYNSMKMTKVMEVYNLSLPIETQLAEFRAWNI